MIECKRFNGTSPSIGYTDFSKVYISTSIKSQAEYDLLYRHECAHIWLQHQIRTETLLKQEGKEFDRRRWFQATDLEIAYHIYDADDEALMNRPRSVLNYGIRKKHTEQYPNCIYAEDFYRALVDKPLSQDSHDGEANNEYEEYEEEEGENQTKIEEINQRLLTKEEIIQTAKDLNQECIERTKKEIAEQKFVQDLKGFRPRPSLASEIDCYLGRSILQRVNSYRRPPRHENFDFLNEGRINKQKIPKIAIYLDRSASFCPEKTRNANEKLNIILKKYRAKIKKDVIFFHDTLFSQEPRDTGGTNYLAVAKDILNNSPLFAVIITDDDDCDQEVGKVLEKCKTKILVLPVGCLRTKIASILNAKEFYS